MKGYQAPAVRKAFHILSLIANADAPLSVTEIALALGMSKGTTFGILSALEREGVVMRDHRKRYSVGPRLIELGRRGLVRLPLRQVAKEEMRRLMVLLGETVFLGVLNEDRITVVEVVESEEELKITSPRGASIPLTAGAAGKVFLASMEESEAERLLKEKGLPPYTKRSITDLHTYMEELKEVKKRGVAFDNEEYLREVRAVATPIETPSPPPAALWLVGFSSRMSQEKMERAAQELLEAARSISKRLKELA